MKKLMVAFRNFANASINLFPNITQGRQVRGGSTFAFILWKVAVKWLALVLRRREVPGNELGLQNNYSD